MIEDDDLEVRLRRYRLGDPPAGLRERVVTGVAPRRAPDAGGWWWGPAAAAAVIAIWLLAHAPHPAPGDDPLHARQVESIAEALGGDEAARAYAERVVLAPESEDAPVEFEW